MTTALIVLHVMACIFLIAVVLLQRGRGAEIGAVFGGGGSSTVFGSRGAGNFLTKLTTISAIIFMGTSFILSYLYTSESGDRLFDSAVEAEDPAAGAAIPVFEEIEAPAAPEADVPPVVPPPAPVQDDG